MGAVKWKDYRQESKKNWGANQSVSLNQDQIKTGTMLRIADSLERMEQPYLKLISDLEYLRSRNKFLSEENERLRNSNRGFKSAITRLKNKSE